MTNVGVRAISPCFSLSPIFPPISVHHLPVSSLFAVLSPRDTCFVFVSKHCDNTPRPLLPSRSARFAFVRFPFAATSYLLFTYYYLLRVRVFSFCCLRYNTFGRVSL